MAPSTSKSPSKSASDATMSSTVYVGRIPHGFYEHQMRAYFSQFGAITRLRLSRNRRTGASKHYAFVEFEDAGVADVVARTMDRYLLFGHILRVAVVPAEQVHPNLWKGAGRRFKRIPWAKLQREGLSAPRTTEVWKRRISREEERRKQKAAKLKEFGYEFDMPGLKQVPERNVPEKQEEAAGSNAAEQMIAQEAAAAYNAAGEAVDEDQAPKAIESTPGDEDVTVETLLHGSRAPEASSQPVKARAKKSRKKAEAA